MFLYLNEGKKENCERQLQLVTEVSKNLAIVILFEIQFSLVVVVFRLFVCSFALVRERVFVRFDTVGNMVKFQPLGCKWKSCVIQSV